MGWFTDLFKQKELLTIDEEQYHYDRTHPHKVQTVEEYFTQYNSYNLPCSGQLTPPEIEIRNG